MLKLHTTNILIFLVVLAQDNGNFCVPMFVTFYFRWKFSV